jgi:uncharacterized protein (UPF0261 family)
LAVIAVLGTFDTKGHEHAYVAQRLRQRGHEPLLIDAGTGGDAQVPADISREQVAAADGVDLPTLQRLGDRGACIAAMSKAAAVLLAKLQSEGKIDGVISLGGGGGTAIASAAMRALPIGFPKLIVSTLAAGNTAHYLGTKDIAMMPSIVDIAGLNRISRMIFDRAAGAMCGMVESGSPATEPNATKGLIAASMFGNTTQCVDEARHILEDAGYEVLVFHATGTGGRTMESLIESGLVDAVLDVTTTELADELVGGVLSAGPDRLNTAGRQGIPTVVAPGCLDMVNFGEWQTVPERFNGRTLYRHNPQVTLMRTSADESSQLGRLLAEKVNRYTGPVSVLLPLRTVSVIGGQGQPFYDPQADECLFHSIRENLDPTIRLVELDLAINTPEFAQACARELLHNIDIGNRSGGSL